MLPRISTITACIFFGLVIVLSRGSLSRAEESQRATPQTVIVEVKVVEVYLDKVRRLGFDWAQISPSGEIKTGDTASGKSYLSTGFLQALAQNELARILAEPTIATLDGRPASFNVAETTKLEILPIVRGDGRVHLECRLELREAHMDGNRINEVKTAANPPIVKLDSASLLEFGKTSLLSRARTAKPIKGGKTAEVETLVLVRVEPAESSRIPTRTVEPTTATEHAEIKAAATAKITK